MISKEIAIAAIQIAEEFDRRNLLLLPQAGSALAVLNALSSIDFTIPSNVIRTTSEKQEGYYPNATDIESETAYPALGEAGADSSHTNQMDGLIDAISEMVTKHLSFAKNTVAPLIKELTTEVNAVLARYPESDSYNPSVIIVSLPDALLNASMQASLREYKEVTYIPITTYMSLPQLSGAEVIELMKVGSKSVDNEIEAWAALKGISFFETIWGSIFTNSVVDSESFESLTKCIIEGVDAAFAVFLLGKRLLDNPPEGVAKPLPEYRKEVGNLLEQAGLRLNQALAKQDLNIKTELLVLSYTKDVVHVFGPVYDKWLAEGGNNAVLFGNMLSDRPSLFLPGMQSKASELLELWEHQNRLMTITLANKRFVSAKSTIEFKAIELIANNLTSCFGEYTKNSAINFNTPEVALAVKNIKEYVEDLTYDALKNIWKVCGELVSKHIFYYTDAYKILSGIERACEENPGIDIAEAALLSSNEYVTDFICDQLCVTDI